MFTNNYINALRMINPANRDNKGYLPVKSVNGTTYYVGNYFNSSSPSNTETLYSFRIPSNVGVSYSTSSGGSTTYYWVVGSGSTPATGNDYILENRITSGISGAVTKGTPTILNNKYCISYTIAISNTSSENKTIREIGYAQEMRVASSQGGSVSSGYQTMLMAHIVLPEDVILAPTESVTIVVTIMADT